MSDKTQPNDNSSSSNLNKSKPTKSQLVLRMNDGKGPSSTTGGANNKSNTASTTSLSRQQLTASSTTAASASATPSAPYQRLGCYEVTYEKLGKGNFAKVYLGTNTKTGEKIAAKVTALCDDGMEELRALGRMHRNFDKPYTVKVHDKFMNGKYLVIVLEHCAGGDLQKSLKKNGGRFPEAIARKLFAQLTEALKCMDLLHMQHRDLKPANILLTCNPVLYPEGHPQHHHHGTTTSGRTSLTASKDHDHHHHQASATAKPAAGDTKTTTVVEKDKKPSASSGEEEESPTFNPQCELRVSDFGFARQGDLLTSCKGTFLYMAPERLQRDSYDFRAEVYAIGLMLHEMVLGVNPFASARSLGQLQALQERFQLSDKLLQEHNISSQCADVLQRTLMADPEKRISIAELANHPWVKGQCVPAKALQNHAAKASSEQKAGDEPKGKEAAAAVAAKADSIHEQPQEDEEEEGAGAETTTAVAQQPTQGTLQKSDIIADPKEGGGGARKKNRASASSSKSSSRHASKHTTDNDDSETDDNDKIDSARRRGTASGTDQGYHLPKSTTNFHQQQQEEIMRALEAEEAERIRREAEGGKPAGDLPGLLRSPSTRRNRGGGDDTADDDVNLDSNSTSVKSTSKRVDTSLELSPSTPSSPVDLSTPTTQSPGKPAKLRAVNSTASLASPISADVALAEHERREEEEQAKARKGRFPSVPELDGMAGGGNNNTSQYSDGSPIPRIHTAAPELVSLVPSSSSATPSRTPTTQKSQKGSTSDSAALNFEKAVEEENYGESAQKAETFADGGTSAPQQVPRTENFSFMARPDFAHLPGADLRAQQQQQHHRHADPVSESEGTEQRNTPPPVPPRTQTSSISTPGGHKQHQQQLSRTTTAQFSQPPSSGLFSAVRGALAMDEQDVRQGQDTASLGMRTDTHEDSSLMSSLQRTTTTQSAASTAYTSVPNPKPMPTDQHRDTTVEEDENDTQYTFKLGEQHGDDDDEQEDKRRKTSSTETGNTFLDGTDETTSKPTKPTTAARRRRGTSFGSAAEESSSFGSPHALIGSRHRDYHLQNRCSVGSNQLNVSSSRLSLRQSTTSVGGAAGVLCGGGVPCDTVSALDTVYLILDLVELHHDAAARAALALFALRVLSEEDDDDDGYLGEEISSPEGQAALRQIQEILLQCSADGFSDIEPDAKLPPVTQLLVNAGKRLGKAAAQEAFVGHTHCAFGRNTRVFAAAARLLRLAVEEMMRPPTDDDDDDDIDDSSAQQNTHNASPPTEYEVLEQRRTVEQLEAIASAFAQKAIL